MKRLPADAGKILKHYVTLVEDNLNRALEAKEVLRKRKRGTAPRDLVTGCDAAWKKATRLHEKMIKCRAEHGA